MTMMMMTMVNILGLVLFLLLLILFMLITVALILLILHLLVFGWPSYVASGLGVLRIRAESLHRSDSCRFLWQQNG